MCEYEFRNGERCKEEAQPNSKYCILHVDLPEDEESAEFKRIHELKEEKVNEKISKEDFNFEGAKLLKVDFSEMTIEGSLAFGYAVIRNYAWFKGAEIRGDASFNEAEIGGDAWFEGAKISGDASFKGAGIGRFAWFCGAKIGGSTGFDGAEIRGDAWFNEAEMGGYIEFDKAEIDGDAWFNEAKIGRSASFFGAKIGGDAWFNEAKIGEFVRFKGAKIDGNASFKEAEIDGNAMFDDAEVGGDASFEGAEIGGSAWFNRTEIKGSCSFKDAKFKIQNTQEEACRTARKTQERIGDRVSADYHFYREMEAKRKQKYKTFSLKPILKMMRKLGLEKPLHKYTEFLEKERRIYWGFLELPVQYIFGYGVYPWRVIATWLLTVFILAFVYWLGNGIEAADSLWEYIYFSVVTAATPGYGGYHPKPGIYQGLASFEAIFGTFMWAAFIATFARKYMR